MSRPLAMVLAFVVGLLLRGHHDAAIGHDAFHALQSVEQGDISANSERRTSVAPRIATPRADERSTPDDADDLFVTRAPGLHLAVATGRIAVDRHADRHRPVRLLTDAQPRGPPHDPT